jgi:hypothetical protein
MLQREVFLVACLVVAIGCNADVDTTTTSSNAAASGTTTSSTGGGSTSTASTASAGGSGGASSSSQGGAGGSGGIVLDPSTLEFFELPIGSLRYAVAGQDQASNTCVTLVWWGNTDPICAMPGMQDWPYVVITPGAQAPCMQWDYGGNVNVDNATGCVDFAVGPPLTATVDVVVQVSGGPYTGTIVADNVP